jgi:hypothetical protein
MKQADIRHALSEAVDITHFAAVAGTDNDIVYFHAPPSAAYFSTLHIVSPADAVERVAAAMRRSPLACLLASPPQDEAGQYRPASSCGGDAPRLADDFVHRTSPSSLPVEGKKPFDGPLRLDVRAIYPATTVQGPYWKTSRPISTVSQNLLAMRSRASAGLTMRRWPP